MNRPSLIPFSFLIFATVFAAVSAAQPAAKKKAAVSTELVGRTASLGVAMMGPFVNLPDGRVLGIEGNGSRTSRDDGKTWSESSPLFSADAGLQVRPERALAVTGDGTVVLVFIDNTDRVWRWDADDLQVLQQNRLNVWAVRSLDGGDTWTDLQLIQRGYCGAIRDIIVTSKGSIVVTSQLLLPVVARHGSITHLSTDNGRTWQASNILDVWDRPGDHAGGFEPTLIEQNDGRLRMLIRTARGVFWETWSADGLSWTGLQPTTIESAHAPGLVKRLASGRQVLIWNAVPGRRTHLHVAFSEDDGSTWSHPVEIARGARISYPYLLERRPGELWITSMQGNLRAKLIESDFVPAR